MSSLRGRQRTPESLTILFSGRFVERKGVKELLAALPQVLEHRPHVRVVLAGGIGVAVARTWHVAGSGQISIPIAIVCISQDGLTQKR